MIIKTIGLKEKRRLGKILASKRSQRHHSASSFSFQDSFSLLQLFVKIKGKEFSGPQCWRWLFHFDKAKEESFSHEEGTFSLQFLAKSQPTQPNILGYCACQQCAFRFALPLPCFAVYCGNSIPPLPAPFMRRFLIGAASRKSGRKAREEKGEWGIVYGLCSLLHVFLVPRRESALSGSSFYQTSLTEVLALIVWPWHLGSYHFLPLFLHSKHSSF